MQPEEQKGVTINSIVPQHIIEVSGSLPMSEASDAVVKMQVDSEQQSSMNNIEEEKEDQPININENQCKYNLIEMLPYIPENQVSEEEVAKMKAIEKKINKNEQMDQDDPRALNKIILEGPISKFVNRHHNLVKRYIVLNCHGLFVYSDDVAFKNFPAKPKVVIPLDEI